MREKIRSIVNKVFAEPYYKTKIHFGYDCIGIELIRCLNEYPFKEVSLYEIEDLKSKLHTEICWIMINSKGNFLLCYDISNMVLSEFKNWQEYEEAYDLN